MKISHYHNCVDLHSRKDHLNESCLFFKVCHHTTFEDHQISGVSAALTSRVHVFTLLLKPVKKKFSMGTASNDNSIETSQLLQKFQ